MIRWYLKVLTLGPMYLTLWLEWKVIDWFRKENTAQMIAVAAKFALAKPERKKDDPPCAYPAVLNCSNCDIVKTCQCSAKVAY